MRINAYGSSDTGRVREINEDSFLIYGFDDESSDGFALLADGMGGHNAGEVASAEAVEAVGGELQQSMSEDNADKVVYNILSSIDYANKKIYEASISNAMKAGMGSTLVVAYIQDKKLYVANIGDSRAYIKSGDFFKQITVDHSVVQELVMNGTITPEEALVHPDKNIITRALGTEKIVDADIFEYDLKEGDVVLLCSDGLYEHVRDNMIAEVLNNFENTETASKKLVELANEDGGTDNITVVILKVAE